MKLPAAFASVTLWTEAGCVALQTDSYDSICSYSQQHITAVLMFGGKSETVVVQSNASNSVDLS